MRKVFGSNVQVTAGVIGKPENTNSKGAVAGHYLNAKVKPVQQLLEEKLKAQEKRYSYETHKDNESTRARFFSNPAKKRLDRFQNKNSALLKYRFEFDAIRGYQTATAQQ